VVVYVVTMIRMIVLISCLCVVSLPDVFENKSETPSDLVLIHIVSNLRSVHSVHHLAIIWYRWDSNPGYWHGSLMISLVKLGLRSPHWIFWRTVAVQLATTFLF